MALRIWRDDLEIRLRKLVKADSPGHMDAGGLC